MFRRDQKLFGYAFVNAEWIEFNSWKLMAMSEVEFRKWKDKYNKIIHVIRYEDSPLIFFNRGHKTFSYFSDKDTDKQLWKNNQITLSHMLRQKVIAEKSAACFSAKDKINRKRDKPTKERGRINFPNYASQLQAAFVRSQIPNILK